MEENVNGQNIKRQDSQDLECKIHRKQNEEKYVEKREEKFFF